MPPHHVTLRLQSPFGPCVAVTIGEDGSYDNAVRRRLAPEEVAFADAASPRRANTFIAGRFALREACAAAGFAALPPVLPMASGAPGLPPGLWASISHKPGLAVAIAASETGEGGLGIDLEHLGPGHIDIGPRVLLPQERAAIAHLPPEVRDLQTRIAFSIKEAIYKAAFPLVQRFFGFQQAEIGLPIPRPGDIFTDVTARLIAPEMGGIVLRCAVASPIAHHVISLTRAVRHNDF